MSDYTFIELDTYFVESYSSQRTALAVDEENDGTRLTVDAGYVDPLKQIQQMILAGEQLNSYREFDDEEALSNDEFSDQIARIRHPNTDITDIVTYTNAINDRLQSAKSEAERQAARQSLELSQAYKGYDKPNPNVPVPPPEETPSK